METGPKIAIIVAVSKNGVIGKEGKIPWMVKSDLKRFASITKGHHILMGRKTYESIGRPLPERINMVLTRKDNNHIPGCLMVHSLKEAVNACAKDDTLFVIGGAELYKEALSYADEIHLTEVDAEISDGDAFFPKWNRTQWKEAIVEPSDNKDGDEYSYVYRLFLRKQFCALENAKSPEQLKVMEGINAGGYCPFCRENLLKNHKKPILYEGDYWIVTENQWPYDASSNHFLIIAREHAEKIGDLPPGSGDELFFISRLIEREHDIESGALCMRFGKPLINGGTVNHIHLHLIVPNQKPGKVLFFLVDTKDRFESKYGQIKTEE